MSEVIKIVLKIKPTVGEFEKSINKLVICAVMSTIKIFTKLLLTRIVASSSSGSDKSFKTSSDDRFLIDFNSLISLGSSENRATSDPEIMAERISKIITITMLTNDSEVNGFHAIPFVNDSI